MDGHRKATSRGSVRFRPPGWGRSIRVAVALSASLTLLLNGPHAGATFRGRNGRIAFALDRGTGAEIYTMRSDGTDRRRLTHEDRSAWFPSWSPDGTSIVFTINVPGENCGSVDMMNADGSDLVDLTSVSPRVDGVCGQGPSFTPDGRRILFAGGSRTLPTAIWSFNVKGKHVRRVLTTRQIGGLVSGDKQFNSPRMSPDGRMLLFEVEHFLLDGSNEKGLFTMRMHGTHLRQIVPFSYDVSIRGGDWAPGGNRLTFSDNAGYSGQTVFTEPENVYTIRPDGSGLRQLTHYRKLPPDVGTGAGSWSPDGRWIMFKHGNNGRYSIWKMHPNGSHLTRIARTKFGFTGATEWGPTTDVARHSSG